MKFFLLLLCFLHVHYLLPLVQAQTQGYKNLVLEGGGIRGIAYEGALAALEKEGLLSPIIRVAGTSAGAIQAALLAVGYSPAQLTEITFKTPVQKLSDGRLFFFGGFPRLLHQFGWYRGEKFRVLLEKLITQKTGIKDLTFGQLHVLAGQNNYRDLYVLGTSLTEQKAIVFSYETYPDMKVSDAVRISMSIPLFFRAVFMDVNGRIVNKPKDLTGIQVMVDGGIVANYPIQLFDKASYLNQKDQKTGSFINSETIGIRLDTDDQIAYDQTQAGLAPQQIMHFQDYIRAFYNIIIEQLNRQTLQSEDWERTISVSTKNYGAKIRRLSEADKAILLQSGQDGVNKFLQSQSPKP